MCSNSHDCNVDRPFWFDMLCIGEKTDVLFAIIVNKVNCGDENLTVSFRH